VRTMSLWLEGGQGTTVAKAGFASSCSRMREQKQSSHDYSARELAVKTGGVSLFLRYPYDHGSERRSAGRSPEA
jgi:hypothetical protein